MFFSRKILSLCCQQNHVLLHDNNQWDLILEEPGIYVLVWFVVAEASADSSLRTLLLSPSSEPGSGQVQSDHSFSSSSESSSDSLYSTAIRRDKMVATSLPTGSRLASCSLCSWTFLSWIPVGRRKRREKNRGEGKGSERRRGERL